MRLMCFLSLLLTPYLCAAENSVISQQSTTQASVLLQSNINKPIQLLHYKFTEKQKNKLIKRLAANKMRSLQKKPQAVQQQQLGMNNVPVLDQGGYGSCVTFANTAAVDALIGQGDYISQLCNLALGQYFEDHAQNYPSGWDGSYGYIVLNQMSHFGIIPKSQEQKIHCGGLSHYPFGTESQAMPLDIFKQSSESVAALGWQPLLTLIDSLLVEKEMTSVLADVKTSILAGDRVTIGFLLDTSFYVGAEGKYHTPNDTWIMTPQIEENLRAGKIDNGHEVIITGFNDAATITDKAGVVHQGVFTLRNSWSKNAGDHGDYYMTYDYFLLMVIEAQRIMNLEHYNA